MLPWRHLKAANAVPGWLFHDELSEMPTQDWEDGRKKLKAEGRAGSAAKSSGSSGPAPSATNQLSSFPPSPEGAWSRLLPPSRVADWPVSDWQPCPPITASAASWLSVPGSGSPRSERPQCADVSVLTSRAESLGPGAAAAQRVRPPGSEFEPYRWSPSSNPSAAISPGGLRLAAAVPGGAIPGAAARRSPWWGRLHFCSPWIAKRSGSPRGCNDWYRARWSTGAGGLNWGCVGRWFPVFEPRRALQNLGEGRPAPLGGLSKSRCKMQNSGVRDAHSAGWGVGPCARDLVELGPPPPLCTWPCMQYVGVGDGRICSSLVCLDATWLERKEVKLENGNGSPGGVLLSLHGFFKNNLQHLVVAFG